MIYNYTKSPLAIDSLEKAIRDSSITIALDYITALGSSLTISFKDTLSNDEQTTLDSIVSSHNGVTLPQNFVQNVAIQSQSEQQPFAQPTHRTKRNATGSIVECNPGQSVDIDYTLAEERYITGGEITIENAQIGDYIIAYVEDLNGVIPAPYRTALCENYPIVAKYIEKAWIAVEGQYTNMEINTYPLNAKITAGLVLCIEYHAVSSGSARKIGVNYYLTKKL